jgi:hypothetical protein
MPPEEATRMELLGCRIPMVRVDPLQGLSSWDRRLSVPPRTLALGGPGPKTRVEGPSTVPIVPTARSVQAMNEEKGDGRPGVPPHPRQAAGFSHLNREKMPESKSADGAPVDSRQSAVTGPLAIGPGALDWGTHAGSAIRR